MRKHEAAGREVCEESKGPCSLEHIYLCARVLCGLDFTADESTHFVRGHVVWPTRFYPFDSKDCAFDAQFVGNLKGIAQGVMFWSEKHDQGIVDAVVEEVSKGVGNA